jgi:hypothetical protein
VNRDVFSKLIQNAESRTKWHEDREHAEKVLDQRRQRYATDKDYRESIKASVRKNRKKKGPSKRKRSFNRDRVIILNGTSVFLYSTGKTAHHLGITSRMLDLWEAKGVIPLNRAADSVGRRWYPADFVAFLAEHASARPQNQPLDVWSNQVKEAWQIRQLGESAIPIVCERLDPNEQGSNTGSD